MVQIIDGYQQRKESERIYDALYGLAGQIFGKGRLCHKNLVDIMVRDGSRIAVDIFPDSSFIELRRKSDEEDTMKLAEKGKEITGKEFTVRTHYKRD